MSNRICLLGAASLLAAVLCGCAPDVPDLGCTENYPRSSGVDAPYDLWITACQNARRDLLVKNVTSGSVLFVEVVNGQATLRPGPSPRDTLSQPPGG